MGSDLLEFPAPEIAEVVSILKNFKTAAKCGKQMLIKQLGIGRKRKEQHAEKRLHTGGRQAYSSQQNLQNRSISGGEIFYKPLLLINSKKFRYQPFVAVSGNLGENVPVAGDVLSSQEHEF